MKQKTLSLFGEEAMVEFGRKLGHNCSGGVVIFLEGELGVGKTTLCRGVLKAFGYEGAVKSPTYTLVEPYELGDKMLCHFDLYRLSEPEELEYMGIRDYFSDSSVCLVEWSSQGQGVLPAPDLMINITLVEEGRELSVEAGSSIGESILNGLDE